MTDPLTNLAPLRPTETFNWSAVGQKGDRSSSEFGGSGQSDAFARLFGSMGPGFRGAIPGTGGQQAFNPRGAVAAGGIQQATAGIGKTDVKLAPAGYQPSNQPVPKAPLKAPGFAEGLLGGLVGVLTGFLPQDIKNTLVGGAQFAGSLLDVPLELVGHIPVNQLVGLENTEGAFNLLPMTSEKQHVLQQIQADAVNRAYYMTQYVRMHQDEYLAAKGLPQVLGNIAMPDQTIMERFMGLLGIPGQLVGRTLAGNGRAMEVVNQPGAIQNESLRTIRERYMAGEYGPPGSQQAIDRMTDVLVSSGLTFSDNPFFELIGELATDPFTWVGGLGVAAKVVQVGALARRAANISRVARAVGAAGDSTVAGLVERVDALAAQSATEAPMGLRSAGSTYRWANTFEREAGNSGRSIVQKAESELSLRDQAQVAMQPVIETLAKGSEIANSAFGLFGVDRVAGNMLSRFARTTGQGALAAFGIENAHSLYQGIRATGQSIDGLNEALSYSLAHAQRALAQNSLIKQLRTNMKNAAGKFLPADWMPDALTDPTHIVDEIRKGNPMEAQQTETLMRRVKKQVVPKIDPTLTGEARKIEYERQMNVFREEGAQQLAYAAQIDINTARNLLAKADPDKLALVDWAHWGRTLKDFEAKKALDVAGAQGLADTSIAAARTATRATTEATREVAGKAIEEQGPLVRATLVGPSDLTLQQAEKLLKAIEAAPDEAAAMRIAEDAINTKEFLYQNLYQKVRVTNDADILARVKVLLKDGIENKRFVSVLDADSLPTHLRQFRDELHARGARYEVGVAPSADRRWAPVIDPKSGHLVGYYPWIEHSVTPATMSAPTRFDIFRERVWQPVRAENILTESRRQFIQLGAKGYHLDKASAQTVFDAIRAKAIENRVGMRAFSSEEFRNILNSTNIPAETKSLLGARGLAELTAKALEGDVKQVGVTSKLSGISKTQTAAYGNYLGQLSEKIYPVVRFNLNPFFVMQEWIEPLFFNVLRGVKLGVKFTDEDVRFHSLMDEWNMGAVLADGFESREFIAQGALLAHQGMGPQTRLGRMFTRLSGNRIGSMHDVKKHNYVFGTKTEFGQSFHRAMDEQFPGQWPRIEAFFNDLDVRHGGKGNLSEGEIATQWFTNKGMYDPDTRNTAINHYDGAIPDQLGRVVGIRRSHVAQRFGYESGDAMRAAIMDPTSGMDEWQVRNTLVQNGFTPEYAERAWQTISGITPEEMHASIRAGYDDPAEGAIAADIFSRWVDYAATLKGISPEEYIARKFTSQSVWLDGSARLPYNAYTQLYRGLAEEFNSDLMAHGQWKWVEQDDPQWLRVQDRLNQLYPDAPHASQSAHIKAAQRAKDRTTVSGMDNAIQQRTDIHGVIFDPDLTMNPERASVWAAQQRARADDKAIVGAADWYPNVGPGFLSYYRAVPDAELLAQARLVNESFAKMGIQPMDLTDIEAVREEITARAIMAWSSTQIQTSPKNGFGFILRAMDENARGRRPGASEKYAYDIQHQQIRRMLLDFEHRISISGFAAKLHDFTDSNVGNTRRRTFMPEGTYTNNRGVETLLQPGAMDIWMGRSRGFIDAETLNHLARRIDSVERIGPEKALLEAQKRTNVWLEKPPADAREGATTVWDGSPSPDQYESMLLYYNRLKDELNDMEGGNGWLNRQWTVADVQAVEWVGLRDQLGIEDESMFGSHATTLQYEFDPGKHTALRELGFERLPEQARDHVIRTVDAEFRRIVQEETGVTFVRYQPGWQNTTDGVVSANSTWTIIGKQEQIADAMHVLSLLTQHDEIVGTRAAGLGKGAVPRTVNEGDTHWAIDFSPRLDGDPVVMELLRIWLDGEQRAGSFAARGSTNAMRTDMRGAVRVLFEDVPKKTNLEGFMAHTPLTPEMIGALEDGTWVHALRPNEEPIPVDIDRRLMTVERSKNDYTRDAQRAEARVRKGEAHDTAYAEEMGKAVQARITKGGRDEIRRRVVDRHIPSIRSVADDAAKHADSKTWAAGRGRIQFLSEGGGGTRTYYQRNPRGWRAATQWNRRRDTAMAVADGKLGGSRGTLYFKRGRVDVTSPVHEFFHFFADDLDPSAISAIHTQWWDSLTDQQRAVRTKPPDDATVLEREAEEWIAPQFEDYSATGILPDMDANLNAVFNAYKGAWDTINKGRQASVRPEIASIFDTMTPEIHRGPRATFDVNQFRMMEAGRIALQRAEEEMFRVHFFKRGRSMFERSINHPYLGMYPASYMWGKVLPELMRFLVKKPFGIDAPFLGMQMANHVWNAIQLEMNTDNSPIANLILEYPEALRFLQLMVPGTPWDVPVNAPAWARRLAQGEWQGQGADVGQALTDTLQYAWGPGRAPADLLGFLGAAGGIGQRVGQMATGQYETPAQRAAREAQARTLQQQGVVPKPVTQTQTPFLIQNQQ